MKIYVTGDTHIPHDIHKLNSHNFPEGKSLTKDDVVIILGDFGLLWNNIPDKEELWWTNWLNSQPWTTLFVDGNHENFYRLNQLPQRQLFGGTVGEVSPSIFHLKRGELYTIANRSFFTFGGAMSVDKEHRVEHLSWWPEEVPSYAEMSYGLTQLRTKPDFILTHTCPASLISGFLHDYIKCNDPTSKYLEQIWHNHPDFEHWYFGHMHVDTTWRNFTCCYNKIIQIL